ncbi:hypothetical protein OIO90_005994 [Microbotryomycetes sp. JL221]|nr:hypothetical protein OIO90_005994 [Microbotryomycetes sp. JL221]
MHISALLATTAALLSASGARAAPAASEEQLNAIVARADNSYQIPKCTTGYPPGYDAKKANVAFPQAQSATTTVTCPANYTQVVQVSAYVVLPYFKYKNGTTEGYMTPDQLTAPVKQMQTNFGKYKLPGRVNFTIKTPIYKPITNRTLWEEMFNQDTDTQENYDRLVRTLVRPIRGPLENRTTDQYQRLYIYLPPSLATATAFAFLPYSTAPFDADGVYFDARYWLYSLSTLTHETGHWMSLLHNFQGGCSNDQGGDLVNDTPPWTLTGNLYEAMCANSLKYGYPYDYNKISNPCNGTKTQAVVSIRNFMNYSMDVCKTDFTSLQLKRMWNALTTLRGFKPKCVQL